MLFLTFFSEANLFLLGLDLLKDLSILAYRCCLGAWKFGSNIFYEKDHKFERMFFS
jgi:hypothetical protein